MMLRWLLVGVVCFCLGAPVSGADGPKSSGTKEEREFSGELVIPKSINLATTPKGVSMYLATGKKSYGLVFANKKDEDALRKAARTLKRVTVVGRLDTRPIQVSPGKADVIVVTKWQAADEK